MDVELILNPKASDYETFQADLRNELAAFKKMKYREVKEPPPAGVLAAELEVVKFVFQHPVVAAMVTREVLKLGTAIVETVRAVIEKIGIRPEANNPHAILVIDNRKLVLPSTPATEQRFLGTLKAKPLVKSSPKKKPRSK